MFVKVNLCNQKTMVNRTKSPSFSGSTNITSQSIRRYFKNRYFKNYDPWRVIAEMIWNGLDARATRIDVEIQKNELGGFEKISILDNGVGIDIENLEDNFDKFGDTTKKDIDQHGTNGRGRLSFHRISNEATWFTKFKDKNASIYIESSTLKDYSGSHLEASAQHPKLSDLKSGTCVELAGFSDKKHSVYLDKLPEKLSAEFGWFLAIKKDRKIFLNGNPINVPAHELHEFSASISGNRFKVSIIRWEEKPSSQKSYNYLLNSHNRIVHKKFSTFNNKANFYVSVYASSHWADKFNPGEPDLFTSVENTPQSAVFKELLEYLSVKTQIVYEDFLREFAEEQISKLEDQGAFPSDYGDDEETARWRINNTKELIRNIYIADPTILNSLNIKQQKIIVRLLDRLLISNENDALLEILESVLDLDNQHIKALAEQLQKTKLEHIVSTIEVLQKRASVVQKLKEVMNNHYQTVLETPDLQKILEANTWLFGPQYAMLGAEEDDFVAIAKKFRNEIKGIDSITEEDVEDRKQIKGVRKQVDLFLARKTPELDARGENYFKCVIIEIKRPGIALGDKHLRQIEEYASILSQHPEYQSAALKFEIILVGRKLSSQAFHINTRLEGHADKGESGLVLPGKFKCYVKNWYTIFDQFDLTNQYLLKHLKMKREDLSGKARKQIVEELQKPSE